MKDLKSFAINFFALAGGVYLGYKGAQMLAPKVKTAIAGVKGAVQGAESGAEQATATEEASSADGQYVAKAGVRTWKSPSGALYQVDPTKRF